MRERFEHQDLLSGFIRMHILYHATEDELYGSWMIEELAHHGYRLSPGTLYPMLHGMEKRGYLKSRKQQVGRSFRRVYRATAAGRKALSVAQDRLQELFRETVEKS